MKSPKPRRVPRPLSLPQPVAMRRWEVVAVISILVVTFSIVAIGPNLGYPQSRPNTLGPDWDCSNAPYTDICVKRPPSR